MINDRCKPGDLAIVIGGKSNIGKIVLVHHALTPDESERICVFSPSYRGKGTIWGVISQGAPISTMRLIMYDDGTLKRESTRGMTAVAPDAWLQPLRPDEDDTQLKEALDNTHVQEL